MTDPSEPWVGWNKLAIGERPLGGDRLRRYQRRVETSNQQGIVLTILKEKAPSLYKGEHNQKLNKEDLDALIAEIVKDCEGHTVRRRHNFLVKGLARGQRELDWSVDIPGRINVMHRDRSPFTPDSFEVLHALRRIDSRFEDSLADAHFYQNRNDYVQRVELRNKDDTYDLRQLHAGQIIYCAVMRGALLDAAWLGRLGIAVQAGPFVDDGELWLELTRPRYEDNLDDLECRRWFPDPLTAGLLILYYKRHGNTWPDVASGKLQVELLFHRFMKAMRLTASQIPTLPQFMQAAMTQHRLSMHGYLVDYARGLNQSVSLPAHAWLRFRWSHEKRPGIDIGPDLPATPRRLDERQQKKPKFIGGIIYPDQREEFRALQEIVKKVKNSRNQKARGVTKALTEYIEESDKRIPILLLLAEWLRDMMRSTRITGTKIKPSSARSYLSAVGKGLLDYGSDLDILEMDKAAFQAYYQNVLATAKNADSKAYKRERLNAFHRYLVLEYQVTDDVLEVGEARSGKVDANIVTPAEYLEAREILEGASGANPRWRTIRRLVLMLGYKCGLRREEIETLYISDLLDRNIAGTLSPRPELIVKNNEHASVKTISSVRRIPLHVFLSQDEIEDLFAWKTLRMRECEHKRLNASLLFCDQGKDTDRIKDRDVFRYITLALRESCGDPDIRFHHLRHSFLNFTLLRLMAEEYPSLNVSRWFGGTMCNLWPNLGKRGLRGLLLLQKGFDPSRRMLYALSTLCGHADPRETLQSYIHILDWCVAQLFWMSAEEMKLDTQAAIENVSLASLRVRRSRKKKTGMQTRAEWAHDVLLKFAAKVDRPAQNGWLPRAQKKPVLLTVDDPIGRPSACLLYDIFLDIYRGSSVNSISERYGYSLGQILKWKRRASTLATLQTVRETSRIVRRSTKTKPDKHLLDRRPALPALAVAPPRIHSERAEAESLYSSMIDLYDSNPEIIEKGIQLCLYRTSRGESWLNLVGDEEKRLFIEFVRTIGIPMRRICLEVEYVPGCNTGRLASKWAKRLQLPKKNMFFVEREPFDGETGEVERTRDPMGLAHLYVASPESRGIGRRISTDHTTWPAHGLRFAVYMAAIHLSIEPKNLNDKEA